jgi:uncharacterized protein (DUF362 family)
MKVIVNKKGKKKSIKWLILLIAITAVSWDLLTSRLEIVEGTFRLESEFDAVTGATARVGIVTSDYNELSNPVARTVNPSYAQIEEMVGKAIELQGGFEWIINKGDKVLIKVNLVGEDSPSGQGENTDVRVVKALIKHIDDFTEGDVVIQIAEGTAQTNDDPADLNSVWGNSGYINLLYDPYLAGIDFSLLNLNESLDDLIEIDLGSKNMSGLQGPKYMVHKAELEADVYIAVPVLKIHDTGITNALKLQVGTAPGCYYGYPKKAGTSHYPQGLYHTLGHRYWTTELIVNLCQIADVDFVLVDAIMCLETKKKFTGNNQVRFNTIVACADPVATDHICAKLMGLNPDDLAHITLAEKVGLGTNNIDQITVAGVPVQQAMKKVKKCQSREGKFGQSNRTWILSQAFDGSDISTEYIENEATFEPTPGENNWTQPYYFFDDRIDLYSFYLGQTNMISYAFTYFTAEKNQQAELWLGTQEAIKIYLNGEEVYVFNSTSAYGDNDLGEKVALIDIKQGQNSLLVKTLNRFGDYSFALNICEIESDPDYYGNRVEGLKFHTEKTTSTAISENDQAHSISFKCYPNPASYSATISFELAKAAEVALNIYDANGQLIKNWGNSNLPSGKHDFKWNLYSNNGVHVPRGVYLCCLVVDHQKLTTKMLVE